MTRASCPPRSPATLRQAEVLDGALPQPTRPAPGTTRSRAAGMKGLCHAACPPLPARRLRPASFVGVRCSTRAPSPPTRLPPSSSSTAEPPRQEDAEARWPRLRDARLPLLPDDQDIRTSPKLLRVARSLPPSPTMGAVWNFWGPDRGRYRDRQRPPALWGMMVTNIGAITLPRGVPGQAVSFEHGLHLDAQECSCPSAIPRCGAGMKSHRYTTPQVGAIGSRGRA